MPPDTYASVARVCFASEDPQRRGVRSHGLGSRRRKTQTSNIDLQIILTGMHLDRQRGGDISRVAREGWKIDGIIPWKAGQHDPCTTAIKTGQAIAKMAATFAKRRTDIVLVVGDRVEALAAATAAHISGLIVAHVHGGDRALGQVDDSLRHAVTKLSHVHFPATPNSAKRLMRLGEDRWRIHRCGSPGIDGIHAIAATSRLIPQGLFAMLALHPTEPDEAAEFRPRTNSC